MLGGDVFEGVYHDKELFDGVCGYEEGPTLTYIYLQVLIGCVLYRM